MTENRGGPRPNSGRKSAFEVSDTEMRRLLLALKREGKKHTGKTWQGRFAEHMFSNKTTTALPFFKMFFDKLFVVGSQSESTTKKVQGPTIYLPEEQLPKNVAPIKKRISKK